MFQATKKLASVLIVSMSITVASKEANLPLKRMLCIYYIIYFKKNQIEIQALNNSQNEVNVMTLVYVSKLGLKV